MRKKKAKKSKKGGEKIHFKKRFMERFGEEINRHDIKEIVDNIQSGDNVTFVRRDSNRVTLFRTRVKGHVCIIVYDSDRGAPVSCWAP